MTLTPIEKVPIWSLTPIESLSRWDPTPVESLPIFMFTPIGALETEDPTPVYVPTDAASEVVALPSGEPTGDPWPWGDPWEEGPLSDTSGGRPGGEGEGNGSGEGEGNGNGKGSGEGGGGDGDCGGDVDGCWGFEDVVEEVGVEQAQEVRIKIKLP